MYLQKSPNSYSLYGIMGSETNPDFTGREEEAWMLYARCKGIDPAEFFPPDGTGVETAQRVCAACPVAVECLEYALLNRIEHGVWGGASERERRRIIRKRGEGKRSGLEG